MTRFDSLLGVVLAASSLTACASATRSRVQPVNEAPAPHQPEVAISWGIPRFFELGRQVRLEPNAAPVDTTGWPAAILRAPREARGYLSVALDDRSLVFEYSEPDPRQEIRRYALVVPEPKTFSTNGVVTAFWGRSPFFMNFALGTARSFASFTRRSARGSRTVIPLRARLSPGGVNAQESENVYELENSRLDVFEHKGLVPGEPLSFLEFTIYDRDSVTDDLEPEPVAASASPDTLQVALLSLREGTWLRRQSFESHGYRVVLVSDGSEQSHFLATPSESQAKWGFGEATTDLTLGELESTTNADAGPGSAAALELAHATSGWLLCGVVQNPDEIPSLLERGERFRLRLRNARRELTAGTGQEFAADAARAFIDTHRSLRQPGTLTRYAHGDARRSANNTDFAAGVRYGQDLASALRGLTSAQKASRDPALLPAIADLAGSSLAAMNASGATTSGRFDQLALLAERDEDSGSSNVFIDNGSIAVAINHRRLLLAGAETHTPGVTWGAFGATIDGQSSNVDGADYEFSVDGASLPRALAPDETELAVSRLFIPSAGSVAIRETAQLVRNLPAVSVQYRLENRSERPVTVAEARIGLADFLDYGSGVNESSQGRYGLAHVADGVHLPVGFWMEGMKAPLWGDSLASGELDLTEQYKSLGARFMLVYGYDRAQIYFLSRPADRLLLYSAPNGGGMRRLEARYQTRATVAAHQSYDLPRALSYTLRVPLQSVDGDLIPDQLQELSPLWTQIVSSEAQDGPRAQTSLEANPEHAGLVYSWILTADLLESSDPNRAFAELVARLRKSALQGARFALSSVAELRNRNDLLPTFANGHDYGFQIALFDWAYRETCDARYREAFLALADDLARPDVRGGLQISDPRDPSYGGFLATQQSRANGATRVGDQGIRLWALRIAYERTLEVKYRRAAELFLNHWLRLDPEAHSFTGTVFAGRRYRDAGVEQERSPLGHYAVLTGLKAWSDILPRARKLYESGLATASGRHVVHGTGLGGPHRLIAPGEAVADFSNEAELGGYFLWATTSEPSALRGRLARQCRPGAQSLDTAASAH